MTWVGRTGFVRVASSEGDRIYRSLDDLPDDLRDQARLALEGSNAETILIADPESYERIVKSGDVAPPDELQWLRPSKHSEDAEETTPSAEPQGAGQWKIVLGVGIAAILTLWAIWLWAVQSGMS
jgi:hypothetical protein